jgi:hypothetical protein
MKKLIAAPLLSLTLLAACGGDDDQGALPSETEITGESPSAAESPRSATEAPANLDKKQTPEALAEEVEDQFNAIANKDFKDVWDLLTAECQAAYDNQFSEFAGEMMIAVGMLEGFTGEELNKMRLEVDEVVEFTSERAVVAATTYLSDGTEYDSEESVYVWEDGWKINDCERMGG